jgi:hypothetical protein
MKRCSKIQSKESVFKPQQFLFATIGLGFAFFHPWQEIGGETLITNHLLGDNFSLQDSKGSKSSTGSGRYDVVLLI